MPYKKVNEEMILLYLDVGKYLFELQQNSKYGDKITSCQILSANR